MDAVWDVLTGALLLGWFTTALFGAVAGAAVAIWARVNVVVGIVVGFVTLFAEIAVLLVIGTVRAVQRTRERGVEPVRAAVSGLRSARVGATTAPAQALPAGSATAFALPPAPTANGGWTLAPDPATAGGAFGSTAGFGSSGSGSWGSAPSAGFGSSGFGSGSSGFGSYGGPAGGGSSDPFGGAPHAGDAWPRPVGADLVPAGMSLPIPVATPLAPSDTDGVRLLDRLAVRIRRPSWPALVVAVLAIGVAIAFAVTTQLTWVSVRGLDGAQIFSVGPFGLQLGAFVVGSAAVAGLAGVGVLLWRSAWWPVLTAWCATWWIFVSVEALTVSDSVTALNRFVQSTVSTHTGYEEQAALVFGGAWSTVLIASVALLATSVALLVLQHRAAARRTG